MGEMTLEQVRDQLREWGKVDHSPLCVNCGYWADAIDAALQSRAQGEAVAWMHNTNGDAFVISDAVKKIWLNVHPQHVEHYTIPLYKSPPVAAASDESKLRTAVHALLNKHRAITIIRDGSYQSVFTMAAVHGCPYTTPPAAAVTDEMVECASEAYNDVYTAEITANTSADNKHQAIRAALEAALAAPAEPTIPVSKVREIVIKGIATGQGSLSVLADMSEVEAEADRILAEYESGR